MKVDLVEMLIPVKILALCASYNRHDVTIAALRSIQSQALPSGAIIQIAVVDDGSSDGTLDSIQNEFPDVLTISTEGGLYWAGAMRFGYARFWDPEKYTHLLVFNDDCTFYPNAISKLIEVVENSGSTFGVVAVGSLRDKLSGALTYGGMKRKPWRPVVYLDRVMPSVEVQLVDTLNMNLALISAKCLDRNVLIADCFTHSLADFDFGLRATKNGAQVNLAPDFLGECSRNDAKSTWEDTTLSFARRWVLIRQPKGLPFRPRAEYLKSHVPYVWPVIFVWPYVKFFILHLFKKHRHVL